MAGCSRNIRLSRCIREMGTDTDEESATNTDKERRRAQHRAERLRTHEEDFGPEKNFFIKTTHSAAERPVFRLLLAPLPSSEKNYIFFSGD